MRRKIIPFAILVFLCTSLLTGCAISFKDILSRKEKPNNFYYTNKLMESFALESDCTINVVYMNFYKGVELKEGETPIVKKFFNHLKKDSFVSKPNNLPEKPAYKMYFTFTNSKYVINIYNARYISVYPWDGEYEVDYIDMKNTYKAYNLFWLSKYVTS